MNQDRIGVTKGNEFHMTIAVQHRYRRFEMRFQQSPVEPMGSTQADAGERLAPMSRIDATSKTARESSEETAAGHFVRQPVKVHLVPHRRLIR